MRGKKFNNIESARSDFAILTVRKQIYKTSPLRLAPLLDNAHKFSDICAQERGLNMAHTNMNLDDDLLAEAMRLTRARTKREVVHLGLQELIRLAKLRKVREHKGKFHWRGDLEKTREEETHEWVRASGRHKRSH